jgi:hypothetical protein
MYLSDGRYRLGACSIDKYAIFAGGCNGNSNISSARIDVFDIKTMTPIKSLKMKYPREDVDLACLGPYVYIGGGDNQGRASDIIEILDVRTWEVSSIGHLLSDPRHAATATTAEIGGLVLFAGGLNYVENEYIGSVDFFACGNGRVDSSFGEQCDSSLLCDPLCQGPSLPSSNGLSPSSIIALLAAKPTFLGISPHVVGIVVLVSVIVGVIVLIGTVTWCLFKRRRDRLVNDELSLKSVGSFTQFTDDVEDDDDDQQL